MIESKPNIHRWGMATCYQGHVVDSLRAMPENKFHCCVTSPPYWSLRSYLPTGHPLKKYELGQEPTPELFVANLVEVFSEVRRVLRDDGVFFLNLGDSYAAERGSSSMPAETLAGGVSGQGDKDAKRGRESEICTHRNAASFGLKHLDICNIPHRVASALQADGWYWRDTIIWEKPSCMPISVNGVRWEKHRVKSGEWSKNTNANRGDGRKADIRIREKPEWSDCPGCKLCTPNDGLILRRGSWRTTCATEYIFMFAKSEKYFCDAEAVKQPAATATIGRNKYTRVVDDPDEQFAVSHDHEFVGQTANPRNVWTISSDNYKGKHYATFPRELVRRCLEAATSAKGCCSKCGAQIARVVDRAVTFNSGSGAAGNSPAGKNNGMPQTQSGSYDIRMGPIVDSKTTGWRPTCQCNAPKASCEVLDPFSGSGTVAQVAMMMGHRATLCELNPEYVEQQKDRLGGSVPLLMGVA